MKQICIIIGWLLLCGTSCSKKSTVSVEHPDYARASYEIENNYYAYRESSAASAQQNLCLEPEPTNTTQKHRVAAFRKKALMRKMLSSREVRDTSVNDEENYQRKNRVANPNANLAFTFGLLTLIPLPTAYLFGIIALVFGIIGLNDMHKEPLKYKGKGKAIFGVTIGTLVIIILVLALIYIMII